MNDGLPMQRRDSLDSDAGDNAGLLSRDSGEPKRSIGSDEDEEPLEDLKQSLPRRPRADTLGSFSFEFGRNLLPIALSKDKEDGKPDRNLTTFDSMCLLIGMSIGSGIFSSPGVILSDLQSTGASMLVWLASGLLAWTGAASYAELGSAIPLNGGSQAYLQYSFGPCAAYLFSWTAITALKPGGGAIIALVFGEYVCRVLYHTAFSASSEQSVKNIPTFVIKLVAITSLIGVGTINAMSNRAGIRTQAVLTVAKLLALLTIAIMGAVQLGTGKASTSLQGNLFAGSSQSAGSYALAIYSGLWAYDGWDQANYVSGEMANATRDLPRVIHGSLLLVVLMYFITNLAYFVVLPKQLIAHSNTVALDFAKAVLGPIGGVVFAIVVAVSCFGALNSGLFTSARLICVAAKEGFLPKVFGKLHNTRKTPVNAVILQTILTATMALIGNFKSLVVFYSICSWTFHLTTIVSLLVLRIREPELERPYKTWISTPVCFACVAVFLLVMPIVSAPVEALAAFGFIAAGLPMYFMTRQVNKMGQNESGISSMGNRLKNFFNFRRNSTQMTSGYQQTAVEEEMTEQTGR